MHLNSNRYKLVLASTSPFRQVLLDKLCLPFETAAPDIDESCQFGEDPQALVSRLAEAKAKAVKPEFPAHLIIGSDQVAVADGKILGKPGNYEHAQAQLGSFSGQVVTFLTGLCLYDSQQDDAQVAVERFDVHFRSLTAQQIHHYLIQETPYHCAGSFKSEGLGIALFDKLVGDDPNTLVGLPLIRLVQFLSNKGVSPI